MITYKAASMNQSGTLATTNICTSELRLLSRHPMIEKLLLPHNVAPVNCTYREDTLWLKDIENEKLSKDWSNLEMAIHCAVWSAYMVKDRQNSANHQWWLWRLPWLHWLGYPLRAQGLCMIEVNLPYEWSLTAIESITTAAINKTRVDDLPTHRQQNSIVGRIDTHRNCGRSSISSDIT